MQISNTEGEDKENDGAGQNPENGSYNLNTIKTKYEFLQLDITY